MVEHTSNLINPTNQGVLFDHQSRPVMRILATSFLPSERGHHIKYLALEIDHEHETVDGEKLFHSDDEIDAEKDDGPTGNEGVTLHHFYHRGAFTYDVF